MGGIVRHDVSLQVADSDDLNVLGMNYPVDIEALGGRGPLAGSRLLIYLICLHNAYYHTYG